MIAAPLPWQQACWDGLVRRLSEERLPHALLFAGPAGLGKRALAEAFARRLLCEQPNAHGHACGQCRGCHLTEIGNHPDLLRVQPEEEGKELTIALVREATAFQELKPQYAPFKVVIVAPAERMNTNAANALLKTLEEPSPGTVLLLVSDRPAALLPTIRSRCQRIDLRPPGATGDVLAWLTARLPATVEPRQALELAGGAPLKALALGESGAGERRLEVLAGLEEIARGGAVSRIAGKWLESGADDAVYWVYLVLCDLIRLKSAGISSGLTLSDQGQRLQALAEPVDLAGLFKLLDRLHDIPRLLRGHINAQLLFEEFLVHWMALFPRAKAANRR